MTEELRESIILALPTYPVCDETCPGVEQTVEMPSDDRWNVLLEKPILAQIGTCPECGAAVRSHRACPKCGTYKGRKVVAAAK